MRSLSLQSRRSPSADASAPTRPECSTAALRLRLAHLPHTAAALLLCGCQTGSIGEPGSLDRGLFDPPPAMPYSNPGARADSGAAAAADAGTGAPKVYAGSCPDAPLSAANPLSRLTNTEYRNTLRTLLPQLSLPELALPTDLTVEGFDNNAKAQTPSPALVEQYKASAEAVADAVAAEIDAVLPCASRSAADPAGCAAQLIDDFVTRAYRRPLQAEERARYLALFERANAAYGFAPAIGMVVQATLQSPGFLYRVELGTEPREGVRPLSGHELASRLSYFFWDDMPDAELLDAAASGALDDATGLENQARRLLADPRARPAIASLFHQWLRFEKMERMPKSSERFPQWNDQVADALRRGTERFVEHVFWDMNGSLSALLTDTQSFVDEQTAPLYGLSDDVTANLVGQAGLTAVQTNGDQRSGILTQAGLLAAFAHETTDSPVLRGVFVMDRLLCSAPPPPPPGVTGSILETDQTAGQVLTTRDRIALTHENGECASCHHTIDGIGFGFSHYDASGRWRDTDNGLDVDATGWIEYTQDADGPFDGAVELGQRLAQSAQVSECASAQWYRYALGLGAADVDSCALAPIAQRFADTDGSLQELMIAIATSDAFRNRTEVEP